MSQGQVYYQFYKKAPLTTYRAQVLTWWVEGGRATVMSCPLPLLFLLRL